MAHFDVTGLQPAADQLTAQGIDVVRLGYADIIGTDRGRDVLVNRFARTVGSGVAFCRSVYGTTPRGGVVDIEGGLSDGLPDVLAFPDLSTLLPIPWEPGVAHCIADMFNPDGSLSAESPRNVLKSVVSQFSELDMRSDRGPGAGVLHPGGVQEVGVGLEAVRRGHRQRLRRPASRATPRTCCSPRCASWGSTASRWSRPTTSSPRASSRSTCGTADALDAADRAHRFKHAIQELALPRRTSWRRSCPSRSTTRAAPASTCTSRCGPPDGSTPLFDDPAGPRRAVRRSARHAVAGILAHAPALAAVANPTINSYKRFGPDTLAPGSSTGAWTTGARWSASRRSAARASRMELRLGDASANSYLAIAGMLAAALLGVRHELEPPEPLVGYGYDATKAEKLPQTLGEALDAFEADTEFAERARRAVRERVPHLQAGRDRPLQLLDHRLGVPRVHLPPLGDTRCPATSRFRWTRSTSPTSTGLPTCAASRSSTPCAPRIPCTGTPNRSPTTGSGR